MFNLKRQPNLCLYYYFLKIYNIARPLSPPLIKDPTFIVFIFFVLKLYVFVYIYGMVSYSFIVFKNDK